MGRLARLLLRVPVVGGAGHLLVVVLPGLEELSLELDPGPLHLGPPALDLLADPLAEGLDLVLSLAELLVRVVEPGLQPALALDRLVLVLEELGGLLVGDEEGPLEAQHPLLEIAPRPLVLPDLVLVVEDLPLLGVERGAQIEDVLLLLVDDLT